MRINKYPDGTSYVKEENFLPTITKRINSYEDLWHLNQYVDVCNYNGYKPTIIIPNLIDAQADKRFNDNESSGLKLVCKFLNKMNANFKIFHPHNLEVVEALIDNVHIIDNTRFIINVLDYLCYKSDELILMSSDAGGFKSLMKLCDKINWEGETASANKAREYKNGETKLIQTLPSFNLKKDILIIDDISVYGGTFKGLSKAIKSVGHQGKLYLAVSHMTVQNLGEDPVTNYFDKVFTTNSKFDEYYQQFNVIKIAGEMRSEYDKQPENLEIIKLF